VCTHIFGVGTSKHLDSVVVGNHKELRGIMIIPLKILIHENRILKSTYVDINFFLRIAEILLGPEPKSMESVVGTYIGSNERKQLGRLALAHQKRGVYHSKTYSS
jgi:hypothetical protein